MKQLAAATLAVIVLCIGLTARAAKFPERPVTIVVPTTPGGIADTTARILSEKLTAIWDVPVIVENRPGVGTLLGAQHVLKQDREGYTLLLGFTELTTLPLLQPQSGIDVLREFQPVVGLISMPVILLTRPGIQASDHQSLVKLMQSSPGKYTYGSNGHASIGQLHTEMYAQSVGVKMLHVPYRGASESITALVGGEVDVVLTVASPNIVRYIEAGRLKVYATLAENRIPKLPDVPTMAELGYPGLNASVWYGLLAPAGVPSEIINEINEGVRAALDRPETKHKLTAMGAKVTADSVASFQLFFKKEHDQWNALAADLDLVRN